MQTVAPCKEYALEKDDLLHRAIDLLSQQVWCWGRDIVRPEGNWLLEVGFDRAAPPVDRASCSSVYSMILPRGRSVVLRGFGVFYGDVELGGVFLPRYEFLPKFTPDATLDAPPWSGDDLPRWTRPIKSQREACAVLTLGAIDWIAGYEEQVAERLGVEYRRGTLCQWENEDRPLVPAGDLAGAWRELCSEWAAGPERWVDYEDPMPSWEPTESTTV